MERNIIQKNNMEQVLMFTEQGIIEKGVSTNIPIGKLQASGFNTYAVSEIDSLIEEIRTAGLITPLSVIGPLENECYRVLSGERRLTALNRMHDEDHEMYEFVPCYVIGDADMPEAAQKLILELANESTRKDYDSISHRFSIVKHIIQLADQGLIRKSNVARISADHIGKTDKYARCYRDVILADNPDIEELVIQKKIDIRLAERLTKLDPDEANKLISLMKKENKQSASWQIYNDYKAGKLGTSSADKAKRQTEKNKFKEDGLPYGAGGEYPYDITGNVGDSQNKKESGEENEIEPFMPQPEYRDQEVHGYTDEKHTNEKESLDLEKNKDIKDKDESSKINSEDFKMALYDKLKGDKPDEQVDSSYIQDDETDADIIAGIPGDVVTNTEVIDYDVLDKYLDILLEKNIPEIEDIEIIRKFRVVLDKHGSYL